MLSRTKIIGILVHIAFGLLLSFVLKPVAIGFGFWMREFGELKSDIPGSIWTVKKNLKMIKASFSPVILLQWVPPALAAYGLHAAI